MRWVSKIWYPLCLFGTGCLFGANTMSSSVIWFGGSTPGKGIGGAVSSDSQELAFFRMILLLALAIAAIGFSVAEFRKILTKDRK